MRQLATALLTILVSCLVAPVAEAVLYLDVRTSDGTIAIPVTSPTQVIDKLEFWTRIVASPDPTQDSLFKFYGSTHSTNVGGGLVLGTLSAAWANTMFGSWYLSSTGTPQDLDGDTDIDLGSTNINDANNWMLGRSADNVTYFPQPDAHGFKQFTLGFTGTAWSRDNPHGVTVIEPKPRDITRVTLWRENGTFTYDVPLTSQTVTLFRPDAAAIATAVNLGDGAVATLDGSATVGSVDTWLWDLDGDGTTDLALAESLRGQAGKADPDKLQLKYDAASGTLSFFDGTAWQFVKELDAETYSPNLTVKYGDLTTDTFTGTRMLILPDPATLLLMAAGGAALAVSRRRQSR